MLDKWETPTRELPVLWAEGLPFQSPRRVHGFRKLLTGEIPEPMQSSWPLRDPKY